MGQQEDELRHINVLDDFDTRIDEYTSEIEQAINSGSYDMVKTLVEDLKKVKEERERYVEQVGK